MKQQQQQQLQHPLNNISMTHGQNLHGHQYLLHLVGYRRYIIQQL